MSLSTQPYKGARDFYPEDKRIQKYMFGKIRQVVESFGYQEYDAPILESFDIYAAKSGEELVNEQLYSFQDRGGRTVAIRPEMTPSVSRMVAGRRQELAYPLRWYSIPNLWRYERPQRGRLREHYQLNVDIFGEPATAAEHEIIMVADSIFKAFGAKPETYRININSRLAMVEAMESFGLKQDELKAAYKIVDKMPKIDEDEFDKILEGAITKEKATKLREYLKNDQPPASVKKLLDLLKASGVSNSYYEPAVVRGLAYYTDIVFEIFSTDPENPRAMLGGGRYDGLVSAFGVDAVPTVGFGMGDVTLQHFLEGNNLLPDLTSETQIAAILIGDVYEPAQKVLAELRGKGINVAVDATDRKLDAKIKSADKSGTPYVLFIGEQELKSGQFKLKNLTTGQEKTVGLDGLSSALSA